MIGCSRSPTVRGSPSSGTAKHKPDNQPDAQQSHWPQQVPRAVRPPAGQGTPTLLHSIHVSSKGVRKAAARHAAAASNSAAGLFGSIQRCQCLAAGMLSCSS